MAELAHRVEFYSLQRKIHIHGVTKYPPKYVNFLCRIFLEFEKAKINKRTVPNKSAQGRFWSGK